MKINYQLVLMGCIFLLTFITFLYFQRTCNQLNEKIDKVGEAQKEYMKPQHFPILIQGSECIRDLMDKHAQLMDEISELRVQLEHLELMKNGKRIKSTYRPDSSIELNYESELDREEQNYLEKFSKKLHQRT